MSNVVDYDRLYALKLGDLGPPLVVTLKQSTVSSNGTATQLFVLQAGDAVTLRYLDPSGTEHQVSMTFTPGVSTVSRSWQTGDLDLSTPFLYSGEIEVQRAGADFPETFPGQGTIMWRTTAAIGAVEPPSVSMINDNASAIVFGAPVYRTSAGHCDLALGDTQAHATVAGLVLDASIAPGASGRVFESGPLVGTAAQWREITGEPDGLTANAAYWADPTTPGKLTTTLPVLQSYATLIGIAASSTMLDVDIQAPVGPLQRAGSMTPIFVIGPIAQSNGVGNAQFNTASSQNQATYGAPFLPTTLLQDLAGNIAGGYVSIPTGPARVRGAKYFTFTNGNFGFELSFTRAMYAAGIKHNIIKSAVGSTSLASDLSPWSNAPPSTGIVSNTSPNLFWRGMRTIRDGARALNGYIAGFVFDQGENDAANAGYAANYQANLEAAAQQVWAAYPGAPIVVVRLPAGGSNTYQATVIAAQNAFAAAHPTLVAIVNTDDIPLQVDGLHYTADGYITLGQRVAAAMLTLQLLPQPTNIPAFTVDATSGTPIPNGDIEWDNFHVYAGIAPINPPSFHHRCQDILTPTTFAATTNLLQDSSGGWNLTNVLATPPVQVAVPGHANKGIGFLGGSTTEQWQTASGWGYNLSTASALCALQLYCPTAPSTYRSIFGMTMASGAVIRLDIAQSGQLRIASNNTTTLSVNSHVLAKPFWVLLLHNKTGAAFTMFSSLEKLTLPYLAQTVDGQKGLGAFSGFQAHAGCTVMQRLDYVGAAAEAFTSTIAKQWLQAMGETIAWS